MKAMGKLAIILLLILTVSLFMTSCMGIVTPELQTDLEEDINKVEEIDYVYLDVPYEKYAGLNWCLPASSAMEFKYFGKDINQQEIANAVITDGASSVYKMVEYARDLGFEAIYNYMTLDEIKELLRENIPVIAIQNYSLSLPYCHARVVIGYDEQKQEIITNDPTAGKDYKISYPDFSALNTASNPDLCKVIVISTEEIDTKNVLALNSTTNF